MAIRDAAPQKRSQELCDEEHRNEITRPQANSCFRFAVLLVPCREEEAFDERDRIHDLPSTIGRRKGVHRLAARSSDSIALVSAGGPPDHSLCTTLPWEGREEV